MGIIKTDYHLSDFQVLRGIASKVQLSIIRRVARCCDFEICGILYNNKIKFLKNISDDPVHTYLIDPKDYFSVYTEINCVFHSHLTYNLDLSGLDILNTEETELSQLIYSIKSDRFLFYNYKLQKKFIFSL